MTSEKRTEAQLCCLCLSFDQTSLHGQTEHQNKERPAHTHLLLSLALEMLLLTGYSYSLAKVREGEGCRWVEKVWQGGKCVGRELCLSTIAVCSWRNMLENSAVRAQRKRSVMARVSRNVLWWRSQNQTHIQTWDIPENCWHTVAVTSDAWGLGLHVCSYPVSLLPPSPCLSTSVPLKRS